jgi:hypothetical protein
MTTKNHDRKEGRSANIGFAKWRVQCFYDSLVQGSSSVFQLKFCDENPPLRKAENRCVQCYKRHDGATKKKHIDSQNIFGKA